MSVKQPMSIEAISTYIESQIAWTEEEKQEVLVMYRAFEWLIQAPKNSFLYDLAEEFKKDLSNLGIIV